MGFASTICFPVVAIVDEEVGDSAEDFERDSVVERHGGDDDGGIMSNRNEGVVLCGGFLIFAMVCCVLFFVEYGSWFLFFLFFPFLVCKIEDRGQW